MPRPASRTMHCRREAVECAAAAAKTALPEVKAAYLDLQQGWLQLAAEAEGLADNSISRSTRAADRGSSGTRKRFPSA